jgi:hypothetical protein
MRRSSSPVPALACACVLACSSASSPSDPSSGGDPHAARYVTSVVSFTPGPGGGNGSDRLPVVVEGPPQGGGCCAGSTDVLSLGDGGEVVVAFDVEIVDGPGADFLVFENPFLVTPSNPSTVFSELGEVSVSDDGVTWSTFPCTATTYPFGTCAGWHTVNATPNDLVDPSDVSKAGGDPFDLADLGVPRAKYVRIRDAHSKRPACCGTAGFDLDAVAVLHGE